MTTTLQPWFRFEPRELRDIAARPFDGLVCAEWELGAHRLEVAYSHGSWWFDDGARAWRCRSLQRALRLFWRRAGAIIGT